MMMLTVADITIILLTLLLNFVKEANGEIWPIPPSWVPTYPRLAKILNKEYGPQQKWSIPRNLIFPPFPSIPFRWTCDVMSPPCTGNALFCIHSWMLSRYTLPLGDIILIKKITYKSRRIRENEIKLTLEAYNGRNDENGTKAIILWNYHGNSKIDQQPIKVFKFQGNSGRKMSYTFPLSLLNSSAMILGRNVNDFELTEYQHHHQHKKTLKKVARQVSTDERKNTLLTQQQLPPDDLMNEKFINYFQVRRLRENNQPSRRRHQLYKRTSHGIQWTNVYCLQDAEYVFEAQREYQISWMEDSRRVSAKARSDPTYTPITW